MASDEITTMIEAVELVKKVNEQKRRQLATNQAAQRAREEIASRQRFIHKQITPVKPVVLSF